MAKISSSTRLANREILSLNIPRQLASGIFTDAADLILEGTQRSDPLVTTSSAMYLSNDASTVLYHDFVRASKVIDPGGAHFGSRYNPR